MCPITLQRFAARGKGLHRPVLASGWRRQCGRAAPAHHISENTAPAEETSVTLDQATHRRLPPPSPAPHTQNTCLRSLFSATQALSRILSRRLPITSYKTKMHWGLFLIPAADTENIKNDRDKYKVEHV
ncbi:hypothetical protein E2C01_026641 [Portunus trituberculatus]|uniref:Uncharacterized protein n=1 Tax=Portunus trituberculatus TaxID=210409 RepID=A0A5B7EJ54_PORTR|nr:hypothetical protein [Portunus trituberculatus]